MWMIGYHDDGELIGIPQPHSFNFNGDHLLRPLISSTTPTTTNNAPFLSPIHGTHHLLALNNHQSIVAEQSKRELKSLNTQQEDVVNVVSSRWNPTPEQLAALEELYRGGTQTPSAEQIHHITAQLRQYGKIEGKNVFYWFQNHKARDRHKRRRRHNHHHRLLDSVSDQQYSDIEITERKESEASWTAFEQTRNWAFPTNCTTLAEGAAKAAVPEESITAARWVQFDEGELLQQRRSFTGSLWPMKSTHHQDLMKIFIAPAGDDILNTVVGSYYQADEATAAAAGGCGGSHHQTLQLFPLRSDKETADMSLAAMNPDFSTPSYQFFEFLPLKH